MKFKLSFDVHLAQGQNTSRRWEIGFQASYQSGIMFELEHDERKGQPYVLIRDSLIRTIGEKLLSALY